MVRARQEELIDAGLHCECVGHANSEMVAEQIEFKTTLDPDKQITGD